MEAKQFIKLINSVSIDDTETAAVWSLIRQAVLDNYITPDMAVNSFASLQGEADNGQNWDEFGIGADLDHWYEDHYDFSRICVYYAQQRAYCSRAKLLTAYEMLKQLIAENGY